MTQGFIGMKLTTAIASAIALPALMAAHSASAGLVTETLSLNQTVEGEQLDFVFTGLAPSDSSDGFITIANAPGSDFDLSDNGNEYFDLLLDGNAAGRYSCDSNPGGGTASAVIMPSCNDNSGDNTFSQQLSFSSLLADFAVDVPSLLADGGLTVSVDFGSSVTPFGQPERTFLDVTVAYNMAASVPEPGTLALLTAGLIGLASQRRKA